MNHPSNDWLPEGCITLEKGEYDVIILGTGLKECILNCLFTVLGTKKVLHIDRLSNKKNQELKETEQNILSLNSLFRKFRMPTNSKQSPYKSAKDWVCEIIPKLVLGCGDFIKILRVCMVTRYLEFVTVEGNFMVHSEKIFRIPGTPLEALKSPLLETKESKNNFRRFLAFVRNYEKTKTFTHLRGEGKSLDSITAEKLYSEFNLKDESLKACLGHGMANYEGEDYLKQPAIHLVEAIKLYLSAMERCNPTTTPASTVRISSSDLVAASVSPFILPRYGLSGIAESFARLFAIRGGILMLDQGIDEFLTKEDTSSGSSTVWGIRVGQKVAKAPAIIGDPSYFSNEKSKYVKAVVRSVCILDHPIEGTDGAESANIIIPGLECSRPSDIFISVVSYPHNATAEGYYVVVISTDLIGDDRPPSFQLPDMDPTLVANQALGYGLKLLGNVLDRYDMVSPYYEAVSHGHNDHCHVTSSYDASIGFDSIAQDILQIYEAVVGYPLDLKISVDVNLELNRKVNTRRASNAAASGSSLPRGLSSEEGVSGPLGSHSVSDYEARLQEEKKKLKFHKDELDGIEDWEVDEDPEAVNYKNQMLPNFNPRMSYRFVYNADGDGGGSIQGTNFAIDRLKIMEAASHRQQMKRPSMSSSADLEEVALSYEFVYGSHHHPHPGGGEGGEVGGEEEGDVDGMEGEDRVAFGVVEHDKVTNLRSIMKNQSNRKVSSQRSNDSDFDARMSYRMVYNPDDESIGFNSSDHEIESLQQLKELTKRDAEDVVRSPVLDNDPRMSYRFIFSQTANVSTNSIHMTDNADAEKLKQLESVHHDEVFQSSTGEHHHNPRLSHRLVAKPSEPTPLPSESIDGLASAETLSMAGNRSSFRLFYSKKSETDGSGGGTSKTTSNEVNRERLKIRRPASSRVMNRVPMTTTTASSAAAAATGSTIPLSPVAEEESLTHPTHVEDEQEEFDDIANLLWFSPN